MKQLSDLIPQLFYNIGQMGGNDRLVFGNENRTIRHLKSSRCLSP